MLSLENFLFVGYKEILNRLGVLVEIERIYAMIKNILGIKRKINYSVWDSIEV